MAKNAVSWSAPVAMAIGYDGVPFGVSDRVELHPGCDLWARGARFGTVVAIGTASEDKVKVTLDALPDCRFSGPGERFRRIS